MKPTFPDPTSRRVARNVVAASIGLVAVALLPRLSTGALRHWDEAWYAQVTREMIERRDPWTLYWNGEPFFHKPPLFFWIQSAAVLVFGEGEFAARLPGFAAGLTLAAVVGLFAARVFRSPWAGAAAVLVLAAVPEFARYAARGQLDAPLALFTALNLVCFWT
ncbi:MAG: ArnT family glycosyltransferase, partial [Planctomycetia bacterium]